MDEFSDLDLQVLAPSETAKAVTRKVELARQAAVRSRSREDAIEHGRLLGEDTSRLLNEDALTTRQRVARAMAYAAWEYDRKPDDFSPYRREFKLTGPEPLLSGLRPPPKT